MTRSSTDISATSYFFSLFKLLQRERRAYLVRYFRGWWSESCNHFPNILITILTIRITDKAECHNSISEISNVPNDNFIILFMAISSWKTDFHAVKQSRAWSVTSWVTVYVYHVLQAGMYGSCNE